MEKKETVLRSKYDPLQVDRVIADGTEFYMLMESETGQPVVTPQGIPIGDESIELMKRLISDIDTYGFDITEPASVLTYVFTYVETRHMSNYEPFISGLDNFFEETAKNDWGDILISNIHDKNELWKWKLKWYRSMTTLKQGAAFSCFMHAMGSAAIPCLLIEIDRESREKDSDIQKLAKKAAAKRGMKNDQEWFLQCFSTFLYVFNLDRIEEK